MNLDRIKILTLRALMSDETLMHSLVLKGGNALQLVYDITNRGSIDIDFSVDREFTAEEFKKMPSLIEYMFNRVFREENLVVFDVRFGLKPKRQSIPEWKGYLLEFKVIEKDKYDHFAGNLEQIRRNAIKLNDQSTIYEVDISAHEYTESATTKELEGIFLRVYTLEMILFEKIRALCQTMTEYKDIVASANPKHRARDVYDIYTVYNSATLDLDPELLKQIFKAKKVPLKFINNLDSLREHNRANWDSVVATVSSDEELQNYDYYFDQLLEIAKPFTNLSE